MTPSIELGRIAVDGKEQFITQRQGTDKTGVELRKGILKLVADSSYKGNISTLPATGWDHDFQQVKTNLAEMSQQAESLAREKGCLLYAASLHPFALHQDQTAVRYGHCEFTTDEVLGAFNQLVDMVDNPPPYRPVHRVSLPLIQR